MTALRLQWLLLVLAGGLVAPATLTAPSSILERLGYFKASHLLASDNSIRKFAIAGFDVAEIISAPGHAFLRDEENVVRMAEAFPRSRPSEPMILNILTVPITVHREDLDRIVAVECYDGHHRLVSAILGEKWQKIGDIPDDWLLVLVDGHLPADLEGHSHKIQHWIPCSVAQHSRLPWDPVSPAQKKGECSAAIDGGISSRDPRFEPQDRGVSLGSIAERIARAHGFSAVSSDRDEMKGEDVGFLGRLLNFLISPFSTPETPI